MLANVHGYQGSHFFADRLLLPAEGWVMLSIEESLIDGCYAVQSAYHSTSDGLTSAQLFQVEAGCEAPLGWTVVESGGEWTVAIAVPDGFDFAGVLRWYDNATPRDPTERAEVAAYYP